MNTIIIIIQYNKKTNFLLYFLILKISKNNLIFLISREIGNASFNEIFPEIFKLKKKKLSLVSTFFKYVYSNYFICNIKQNYYSYLTKTFHNYNMILLIYNTYYDDLYINIFIYVRI